MTEKMNVNELESQMDKVVSHRNLLTGITSDEEGTLWASPSLLRVDPNQP